MDQYKTEVKRMFRLREEQMDDVEMEWKAFKDGYFRKADEKCGRSSWNLTQGKQKKEQLCGTK